MIAEQLISTMQSLLMLTVVLCGAVTGSAGEDDKCAMVFNVGKCCALSRIFPADKMASTEECKEIYFTENPPTTISEVSTILASLRKVQYL